MAAEDVRVIDRVNIMGREKRVVRVNGPASYSQSNKQQITPARVGLKKIESVTVASHAITDSTGAPSRNVTAFINGSGNILVHWSAIGGGTQVSDSTDLSGDSIRLEVWGL